MKEEGRSPVRSRKLFKGTESRDFLLQVFFHESPFPKPLKIMLGSFRIFRKFAEIFASQGAPPVSTTPVAIFASGVNDTLK
jgi:hypothetical protein